LEVVEVDNNKVPYKKNRNNTLLSEMWLYGVITAGLVAISNLVLFLALNTSQMLAIAGGAILCAGLFLVGRRPQNNNQIFLSSSIGITAWVIMIILHELFWTGILGFLLVVIWLLPVIWFFGLPAGFRRVLALLPCLVGVLIIIVLERYPFFNRISVVEFSLGRFITPIYTFILGVLIFLVILRGMYIRLLSARMIASMAIIVFIPIVILTMVTYSNTKLNDTLSAVNSLDQTVSRKGDEVIGWTSNLSNALVTILNTNESYQQIIELLLAHDSGNLYSELVSQHSLTTILNNAAAQYGMEEIDIMDPIGLVIASTRADLINTDFRYYDFFWQGKTGAVTLPPRFYPPEDEISIFVSHPILNYSNEIVGVLSARTSVDTIIDIVNAPVQQPYHSTLSYLVNADGALLVTSFGRPTINLQTDGAKAVLETLQNGSASYKNIDGQPVVGVYHWLPELKVAILVEASQAEIYQRLPNIITANLAIGLLAFLLAVIAAITIVRSITKPITALVKASQDVIDGNFAIHAETDREDELGMLTEAFNKMTDELKVLVSGLETRVADRTRDLEHRSLELQTAALIARDTSLASNINDLLNRTTRLIRERFGYYHVGIFLNDDKGEYTVLRSAAGDAGQVLLASNHKLKIGETGIVGIVAKTGEPRIALDVGADAVYFRNPLLLYTRSEMALPLKIGAQIIGVLDVQSDKVNAYDQNNITIMSILTDQLSIAIERTRLLQESNQNTASIEMALQSQTSRVWSEYLSRSQTSRGFRYGGVEVESLDVPDIVDIQKITASNKPRIITDETGKSGVTVAIPIQLRGQAIGALKVQFTTNQIQDDTLHFLEEASNRLSLALENARLFQDAQHLASQEQQINIISGQIQQSTELEVILQNTVKELGKTLGVPKTFIQIGITSSQENDE
jgi:nitrate/nitrite-specific signal transduction histidine kinase